jgi:hypothetical protein
VIHPWKSQCCHDPAKETEYVSESSGKRAPSDVRESSANVMKPVWQTESVTPVVTTAAAGMPALSEALRIMSLTAGGRRPRLP